MSTVFPFGYACREGEQPSLFTAAEPEPSQGSLPPLRGWQERTIPQIRDAIREGHTRIVVQAATGAGKTLLAASIFASAIAKGKRPMFCVPDITLVDQTLHSFERGGIDDIGVIQAQHIRTNGDAQVQIASIQSLVRRAVPDVDLIVIDEIHVQFAALYKLMDSPAWADKVIIGLSATPWAKGMGHHWTKLIIGATIKELIAEKILCGFKVFVPSEETDFSQLHIKAGEFVDSESSALMSQAKITGDVVKTWKERWNKPRTFMFCVDRAHAKAQRMEFENQGIPFGYIDGTMSIDERYPVFVAFRKEEIMGIASVGCLSRGVDEDVHCIIDAKPKNSEMAYVQEIGRGLRNPLGNGKELLILDHAGNAIRLGLVTDIHHEKLDNRKPGSKEKPFAQDKPTPKPKRCEKCFAVIPKLARKCPACGSVVLYTSNVISRDGELVEFGSGKKSTKQVADPQAWFSGFLWLAQERGHKEGWAAYRFREKFGKWPNGLNKETAMPTAAVRSFDAHLRIRAAKSKQKAMATDVVTTQ